MERCCFRPVHEGAGGKAAEEDVAWDEICEDICAVGDELWWCLEIGLFQTEGGAVVVLVGEIEAAEVVEESDALGGGIER